MSYRKRHIISRGKFFRKQEWYSICSMHSEHNPECNMCTTGNWRNVWLGAISSLIYKITPGIWRWFVNLPPKNKKFFDNFEKLTK